MQPSKSRGQTADNAPVDHADDHQPPAPPDLVEDASRSLQLIVERLFDAPDRQSARRLAPASAMIPGMGESTLTIRAAVLDDADAMGRLHVRAWQRAYRGVMPDAYLDALLPSERAEMWRGNLARAGVPPVLVATLDDTVVGCAAFGAAEPPTPGESATSGELYAINLDPDHWGRGIGRSLLRRATDELAALGYDDAVLWVLPENARARALYESEGWTADGGVATEEILGVTVTDIRYRKSLAASADAS